jgi:tetratricopeptide (TPR) repeat protein
MCKLARLLSEKGEHQTAEQLVQRAVEISQKIQGSEHPNTAASHYDLGTVLSAKGELAEAHHQFAHALRIRENTLGADHPLTAALRKEISDLSSALERVPVTPINSSQLT